MSHLPQSQIAATLLIQWLGLVDVGGKSRSFWANAPTKSDNLTKSEEAFEPLFAYAQLDDRSSAPYAMDVAKIISIS